MTVLTDDELQELRVLAAAMEAWEYDEDGPICANCEDRYSLDIRSEPTPLCDSCAQRAVARLPRLIDEINRLRAENVLLMPASWDHDPEKNDDDS